MTGNEDSLLKQCTQCFLKEDYQAYLDEWQAFYLLTRDHRFVRLAMISQMRLEAELPERMLEAIKTSKLEIEVEEKVILDFLTDRIPAEVAEKQLGNKALFSFYRGQKAIVKKDKAQSMEHLTVCLDQHEETLEKQLAVRDLVLLEKRESLFFLQEQLLDNAEALVPDTSGDVQQLLREFDRILSVLINTLGTLHPHLGRIYLLLGDVCMEKLGDFTKARSYYSKAIELRTKVYGEGHFLVARAKYALSGVLFQLGKFKLSFYYADQSLDTLKLILPPLHTALGDCHLMKGNALASLEDFHKGIEELKKAEAIFSVHQYKDLATVYSSLSNCYLQIDEADQAEDIVRKALEIKINLLGEEVNTVAESYTNLGQILWKKGDLEGATGYLERSLSIRRKVLPPNHPLLAISLTNLGGLYEHLGNEKKAEAYFREALEIRRKSLGTLHVKTVHSLTNLGVFYLEYQYLDQAAPLLEEALSNAQKTFGENHPVTLDILRQVGRLNLQQKENTTARKIFKILLFRQARVFGIRDDKTIKSLNFVTQGYPGEYIEIWDCVDAFLRRAFSLCQSCIYQLYEQQDFLFKHHQQVGTLYLLALCLRQLEQEQTLGEYIEKAEENLDAWEKGLFLFCAGKEKAEALQQIARDDRQKTQLQFYSGVIRLLNGSYQRAIEQLEQVYSDAPNSFEGQWAHLELAFLARNSEEDILVTRIQRLNNRVFRLVKVEKMDEASTTAETSIEVARHFLGANHLIYGVCASNLGLFHLAKKNYSTASSFFREAISIFRQLGEQATSNLAFALHNLGEVLIHQKNYDEAFKVLAEALRLKMDLFAEAHPSYINTLQTMGRLHFEIHNYPAAEAYYKKAVELQLEVSGGHSHEYANAKYYLGLFYLQQGKKEEAQPLLYDAREILKEAVSENHPKRIQVERAIIELEEKPERNEINKSDQIASENTEAFADEIRPMLPLFISSNSSVGINLMIGYFRGDFTTVLEAGVTLLSLKEKDGTRYVYLAFILLALAHLGRLEEARALIQSFKGQLFSNPNFFQLLNFIIDEAEIEAPVSEPGDTFTNFVIVEKHYAYGAVEKAKNLLVRYLAQSDGTPSLLTMRQKEGYPDQKVQRRLNPEADFYYRVLTYRYYFENGDFYEAQKRASENLVFARRFFDKNSINYLVSINNLAIIKMTLHQYDEAAVIFQDLLEKQKAVLGEKHPEYLITLDNLAALYLSIGRYEEALEFSQKATDTFEEVLGKNSVQYATALNNQACIYLSMKEFDKAQHLLEESLEFKEKANEGWSIHFGTSLLNLGQTFRDLEMTEAARNQFNKAREVFQQLSATFHPEYFKVNKMLLKLHLETQEPAKAFPLLMENRQIGKSIYGEEHPEFLDNELLLVQYHLIHDEMDPAEKILVNLGSRLDKTQEQSIIYLVKVLKYLSKIYKQKGQLVQHKNLLANAYSLEFDLLRKQNNTLWQALAAFVNRDFEYCLQMLMSSSLMSPDQLKSTKAGHAEYILLLTACSFSGLGLSDNLKIQESMFGFFKDHQEKAKDMEGSWEEALVNLFLGKMPPTSIDDQVQLPAWGRNLLKGVWGFLHDYESGQFREILKNVVDNDPFVNLASLAWLLSQSTSHPAKENPEPQEENEQSRWEALAKEANQALSYGAYNEAIQKGKQLLEMTEMYFSKTDERYFDVLNNLANSYLQAGNLEESRSTFQQLWDLYPDDEDHQNEQLAVFLNNYGILLNELKAFDEAISCYKRAIEIKKKLGMEKTYSYSTSVVSLATLYKRLGRYEEAAPLFVESLELDKNLLTSQHPEYAKSLFSYGLFLEETGQLEGALTTFKEAMEIYGQAYGYRNAEYLNTYEKVAWVFSALGQLNESEQAFREIVRLWKVAVGEQHLSYAKALQNLGSLLVKEKYIYVEAESLLKKAQQIFLALDQEETLEYYSTIMGLATIYKLTNESKRSVLLLEDSLEYLSRHQSVAPHLLHAIHLLLGEVYNEIGNIQQSIAAFEQALRIQKEIAPRKLPLELNVYLYLGNLYQEVGKLSKAFKVTLEGVKIAAHAYGKESLSFAEISLCLSRIYWNLNQKEQAEIHFDIALKIINKPDEGNTLHWGQVIVKNALFIMQATEDDQILKSLTQAREGISRVVPLHDIRHIEAIQTEALLHHKKQLFDTAEALYDRSTTLLLESPHEYPSAQLENDLGLAFLYFDKENLNAAALFIDRAVTLIENRYPQHYKFLELLVLKAKVYAGKGQFSIAVEVVGQIRSKQEEMIDEVFSFTTASQRFTFLKTLREIQSLIVRLAASDISGTLPVKEAYNYILRRKSIGIESLAIQKRILNSTIYPHLTAKTRALQKLQEEIVSQQLLGSLPEQVNLHQKHIRGLMEKKAQLETALAADVPEISISQLLKNVRLEDFFQYLPGSSVLIEYVLVKNETQQEQYFAFVIQPDFENEVHLIALGNAQKINDLIYGLRNLINSSKNKAAGRDLVTDKPEASPEQLEKLGVQLRSLIFDPLLPYFRGMDRLFIVPDDALFLLPFEILPIDENKYIIDAFKISYLPTTRDILRFESAQEHSPTSPPVVIANPDFDLNESQEEQVLTPEIGTNISRDFQGKTFIPLPGAEEEGREVLQLLKKWGAQNVELWLGKNALKSQVKNLKAPIILHLATHGFFLEDDQHLPEVLSELMLKENTLLRSGLALTAANWKTKGFTPPMAAGDGILTAEEVKELNLHGTELVVLSACDTGIGAVQPGEGVFGFRLAFSVSGARTLVMSMWKIPDHITCQLMSLFYKNMMNGHDRAEALRMAQLQMKAQHPHPYYWGGFICQGYPFGLQL